MGLGVPAMTTAALVSVRRERSGIASAVLNAAQQAAGAMGVALFGTLAGDAPGNIVAGLRVSATIASVLLITATVLAVATIARHRTGSSSQAQVHNVIVNAIHTDGI